jgi:hypothetical protein
VTRAIGKAAGDGLFTDPARMQRFDATFANRYFAALNGYFYPAANPPPSHCWRVAFEAAEKPSRAIVLHMLTGMNAHIELDLGITAWETAKPAPLESLHADFDTVNAVLAQQIASVLEEIDEISPVLADIYDVLQKDEIHIIEDGLIAFRDGAWRFASVLSAEPGFLDSPTIGVRDLATAAFGSLILNPPPALAAIANGIIARESADVVRNIDEIAGIADQDIVKATADR